MKTPRVSSNPRRIRGAPGNPHGAGAPPGGKGNYHKTPRPWSKRTIAYTPDHAIQARKLCRLGLPVHEMADLMAISTSTFNRWLKENTEFRAAVLQGRTLADAEVADKLYHRAVGYSHEAEKVISNFKTGEHTVATYTERFAPDTHAATFWLKNRQPDYWKDRQEHTGANGGPIEFAAVLAAAIEREARALEAPVIEGDAVEIGGVDGRTIAE